MKMKDFSIGVCFNQKGIDERLTSYLESLIIIKDFLKENFPNLLNNLGRGEYNSVEFDNYRIVINPKYFYFKIEFIKVNEVDELAEKNIYLIFDKILHLLNNKVKEGRINDYIDYLQLNFVFNQTTDNCIDLLKSITCLNLNENVKNISIALTSFIPHKTNITMYKLPNEIYSILQYNVKQFIDVDGKDISNIRNSKNEIINYINSLIAV